MSNETFTMQVYNKDHNKIYSDNRVTNYYFYEDMVVIEVDIGEEVFTDYIYLDVVGLIKIRKPKEVDK